MRTFSATQRDPGSSLVLGIILAGVCLVFASLASMAHLPSALLAVGAVALFVLAFINPNAALFILVFSMLLSPEITVGEMSGEASLGRGITLRLDDFLLLIMGFGWFAKAAVHKDLGLFLRTPLNRAIGLYLFSCSLSTALGVLAGNVDAATGFFYVLKYFEYFIVYFMAVNLVKTEGQARTLLLCLFITAFFISLYGILQIPGGARVTAPFEGAAGEPNTLGGYFVFVGLLAAGLFLYARDPNKKAGYAILLLVMIPPFLFTQSRASYGALIPGALALAALSRKKSVALLLVILTLMVSPFLAPQKVKDRVAYTYSQELHTNQVQVFGVRLDTSTTARLMSWKQGLSDWRRHPLLGFGVTGYDFMDAQFPRVLVETGLVGLSAFLYLLLCVFRMARDRYKRFTDPFPRGLAAGYLAGFIALCVHALGVNTFIIVRIMEPFWFVTAILVVLPGLLEAPASVAGPETSATGPLPLPGARETS
ncbi:MAG: O-antigen ligase family protein [Pseudomonadota bacterium]